MCLKQVKIADCAFVPPLSFVIRTSSKTHVLQSGNNTADSNTFIPPSISTLSTQLQPNP
jgi:hypothetical protein